MDNSDKVDNQNIMQEYLTTGDVAKNLGVSRRTVQRICDRGELKSERVTKTSPRRIRLDAFLEYIKDNGLTIQLPQMG